ncbi:MAG: PepSY domain-containing protein [Clostridia bacterium]|nr:PepSY domain-containing protein [Clostridia bacterium]
MKNRRKALIVLALASVMITGSIATAFAATTNGKTNATEAASQASEKNRHGKKEKIAEPDNAIGKEKAQAAALKDAGIASDKVEKIRTHVSKLDDGTVVYKVGFVYGDKYYSYKINALTGAVADKSEQSAEEHAALKSHGKNRKKEETAEPDNAIGKETAQAAALKDAGISSDKVEKIRTYVSKLDDGTVVYKVGFIYGDKHYSYKINALTGAVADKSEKSADEMQNGHGHKKDKAEISGTEKSGNE